MFCSINRDERYIGNNNCMDVCHFLHVGICLISKNGPISTTVVY